MMGMDLDIQGLDDNVGRRLREQAEAAGLSVQQYVRDIWRESPRASLRPKSSAVPNR